MSGVLATVIGPLLPVVLCVATGALLAKVGLLPPDVRRGVERLVYWALLPALLVEKLSQAPLAGAGGDVARMLAAFGGATVLVGAAAMATAALIGMPVRSRGALVQVSLRGNLAFVGLPVIALAASGDPEPPARAALVLGPMVVLYNLICVPVLIGLDRRDGLLRGVVALLRPLGTNPILLACVVGLLLTLAPPLPAPLTRSVALVGQPAGPLALLCLGAAVTGFRVRDRLGHACLAVAGKGVALPLLAVGLGLALGLQGADLRSVAIFASAPTAVASYVLTSQLRGDEELTAAAIAASTLFAVVPLGVAMTM